VSAQFHPVKIPNNPKNERKKSVKTSAADA